MTTMIIDNKATAKRSYESYTLDENIYNTEEKLKEIAFECMNKEVYLIRVYKDNKELFTIRNYQ